MKITKMKHQITNNYTRNQDVPLFGTSFFPLLKVLIKKKHSAPHNLEQCTYGLFLAGLIDVTMML